MIAMISHEIGIHLFFPFLQEKIRNYEKTLPRIKEPGLYGLVSYMAFESLISFYNEIISDKQYYTGRETNDYYVFKEIFLDLLKKGTGPLEMFPRAIERYLKLKGESAN